jgi:hypothetical protein
MLIGVNPFMLGRKLFLLFAFVLIVLLYIWGHNSGEQSVALASAIRAAARSGWDLLATLALIAVGAGIGRRALSHLTLHTLSRPESLALSSATGLGIISLLGVIAGLAGFFQPALWIGLLLLATLTFSHIRAWFAECRAVLQSVLTESDPWSRFVLIYAACTLLLALLLALAPPFRWDAVTYHLPIPAQYIRDGTILPNADNHFFGFPQNMEILYGLLMLITGSDQAPAVLHCLIGVLGLLAIAGWVKRCSSRTTAATAVLIPLTSYNIWLLFGWAYVDLAMLLYGTLALIAYTEWRHARSQHWLMLMGILTGLALGVKYTAASIGIALAAGIFFTHPRGAFRSMLVYGIFSVIPFIPWMIKGMLLYGNPIYPYLFHGLNWDALRSANFGASTTGLLHLGTLYQLQIPLLPFAATIFGIDGVSPYMFTTGAWLLTLPFALPLVAFRLNERARWLARSLLVPAVVLLLFWMLLAATSGIGAQPRLMLVGAAVAAVTGALAMEGISRLPRRPLDLSFLLRAIMLITIFFSSFDMLRYFAATRTLEWHTGALTSEDYLRQNLGIQYDALQQLRQLPDGSKVLFLWENKSYYCPQNVECIADVIFDNWARPLMLGSTVEQLIQQWQERGINYFLLTDNFRPGTPIGFSLWLGEHDFARPFNQQFPDFVRQYLRLIWTDEIGYALYTWQ